MNLPAKLAVFILLLPAALRAQQYNPYQSIGKKAPVLTASDGKYVEVFDYDTIQRIGTVLINIRTKKVVKLLKAGETFTKYSDNSAASRWYRVDPLADKGKNISYSPYAFVTDNPISYNDPDGQDGIRVVDQKNKTITITATYYVQTGGRDYVNGDKVKTESGYSDKTIGKMQDQYNKYLNGLGLSVSDGDYKGYSVKFDLTFKAGGTPDESEQSAKDDKVDGNSVGNSFELGNAQSNPRFQTQETDNDDGTTTTRTVGGQTADHKYIMMNDNEDTKMNRIHEIFHTFGFNHPKGTGGSQGIMKYPPDKPSQADANQLGNGTFLPVVIIQNNNSGSNP